MTLVERFKPEYEELSRLPARRYDFRAQFGLVRDAIFSGRVLTLLLVSLCRALRLWKSY